MFVGADSIACKSNKGQLDAGRSADYNAPLANVMTNVQLGASSVRTALENAKKCGTSELGMTPLKRRTGYLPGNSTTIDIKTINAVKSLMSLNNTRFASTTNRSTSAPVGHKLYTASRPTNNIFSLRIINDGEVTGNGSKVCVGPRVLVFFFFFGGGG